MFVYEQKAGYFSENVGGGAFQWFFTVADLEYEYLFHGGFMAGILYLAFVGVGFSVSEVFAAFGDVQKDFGGGGRGRGTIAKG